MSSKLDLGNDYYVIIKSAKGIEFVFLDGMRIMDDFKPLAQLSDDERDKACRK
ncbi:MULTISPECIES: hypothetical protein [Legionella]|uniref:hypothetical protein n=1 Tax=Legionella TaxID=445 RepID=UPI000AE6DA18|nr:MULTISPECIES: hypothetical protein [Legionella]